MDYKTDFEVCLNKVFVSVECLGVCFGVFEGVYLEEGF